MNQLPQIVNTATMITLLGGGSVNRHDLALALELAPILVAADGGANVAFDWDIRPHAVIGDLDSVCFEKIVIGCSNELKERGSNDQKYYRSNVNNTSLKLILIS